jgi:hypothetical protein
VKMEMIAAGPSYCCCIYFLEEKISFVISSNTTSRS